MWGYYHVDETRPVRDNERVMGQGWGELVRKDEKQGKDDVIKPR